MPWEALTDIDSGILSAMIVEVRHASNKARDLIMAMRIIRARQGRLDLAFLALMRMIPMSGTPMRYYGAKPRKPGR